VSLYQVKSGYFTLGLVRSGKAILGHVESGQVRLRKDIPGYGR
jgi:hypothetical protein